jgi:hypothetical protein
VGNSRGARKLARTPHVNQKKKKRRSKQIMLEKTFSGDLNKLFQAKDKEKIKGE